MALIIGGVIWTAVVEYVALRTARGQWWDNRGMTAVSAPTDLIIHMLRGLNRVSVASTAFGMGVCMLAAMLRRRWSLALAAAVLVAGSNVTTQILKYRVLSRADFGVPNALNVPNSLPSGHTTVVTSLALAVILVCPRVLRIWAVLGTCAMTTLVGVSVVLARWHRPSDVLAAIGVCTTWAGVGLLVATLTSRHPLPRPSRSMGLWYAGLGLLGPALVALLVDRLGIYAIGSFRSSMLAAMGLLTIGLSAVVAASTVGATTRRVDQPPLNRHTTGSKPGDVGQAGLEPATDGL